MSDSRIDRAFEAGQPPDRELIERISRGIVPHLRPVRPLPPAWVLTIAIIVAAALVGVLGGVRLGLYGLQELTAAQTAVILTDVAVLMALGASTCVAAMIPAARRVLGPVPLLVAMSAALAGVFLLLFRDYSTDGFVPDGIVCFKAGLWNAVPAAALVWLILRRGAVLDSAGAGAAAGALAGLAGLLMLELHCPNFQLLHVLVWHIAVIPVSAAAGWLVGRAAAFSTRR